MFPQLSDLRGGVDTALLPVGGWGPTLRGSHLNSRSAAEAAAIIAPRVVLPIHWGTYWPAGVPLGKKFSEPGPRFVEHMSAIEPDIDARLWSIGEPQLIRSASGD
jgi:L-ascorbate metabolism protein UlaG (beta-lactamase superfamily)